MPRTTNTQAVSRPIAVQVGLGDVRDHRRDGAGRVAERLSATWHENAFSHEVRA